MSHENFVNELLKLYITNNHANKTFNFYYKSPDSDTHGLLGFLSQKFSSKEMYKLLSIRKYPFVSFGNSNYVLTDNTMLLEKTYNQFINDFWFDYIKGLKDEDDNPLINIIKYKSIIGYYFERYVAEAVQHAFAKAKHYTIKLFADLKVSVKGNETEIADLYVRHNKKVILGQVKATSIYDKEKYSGDIDSLYKNDRNKFFKSFGVDQLVKSINTLESTIRYVDPKFPANKPYQIFPIIVVNENSLRTQLMPKIFQDRFSELISERSSKVHIYPLSIVHISDIERVEDILHEKPGEIWKLLKFHCRNPKFMPPFYNSLSRKGIKTSSKRILAAFRELIEKHNGELASKISESEN